MRAINQIAVSNPKGNDFSLQLCTQQQEAAVNAQIEGTCFITDNDLYISYLHICTLFNKHFCYMKSIKSCGLGSVTSLYNLYLYWIAKLYLAASLQSPEGGCLMEVSLLQKGGSKREGAGSNRYRSGQVTLPVPLHKINGKPMSCWVRNCCSCIIFNLCSLHRILAISLT